MPLIERNLAITDIQKNLEAVNSEIKKVIKGNLSKSKLIIELVWQREQFSRAFFSDYQGFDLSAFMSYNFLICKLTKEPYFHRMSSANYPAIAKELVDAYEKYIQMYSQFFHLREGFAEAVNSKSKVKIIPNELYSPILSTYEDNDIMEQEKSKEKVKIYKQMLEEIKRTKDLSTKITFTPERFIETFYDVICQLYSGLLRNELYDEVFGLLSKFKEIKVSPSQIMDFVNFFPMVQDSLYHVSVSSFLSKATAHFKITDKQARQYLLFYDMDCEKFPLFVMVNGRVYVSHRTAFLLYVLMHALFYKDAFNRETEKRSKAFEQQEVKTAFESIGWKYFPNITDKRKATLEIDGIATLDVNLLVVECKGWQLKPYYEYKDIQDHLERDIKGIVDGQKFTKGESHKIPSLLEKIDYVKENLSAMGITGEFKSIGGLVVLRSYPPISEYKGVKVSSIKDIPIKLNKKAT
jgi:hypothetical protein